MRSIDIEEDILAIAFVDTLQVERGEIVVREVEIGEATAIVEVDVIEIGIADGEFTDFGGSREIRAIHGDTIHLESSKDRTFGHINFEIATDTHSAIHVRFGGSRGSGSDA